MDWWLISQWVFAYLLVGWGLALFFNLASTYGFDRGELAVIWFLWPFVLFIVGGIRVIEYVSDKLRG